MHSFIICYHRFEIIVAVALYRGGMQGSGGAGIALPIDPWHY